MEKEFELLRATRQNAYNLVNSLVIEKLSFIPANGNNNVFWNFAHCIVTQQILCYKLSGVDFRVDNNLIELYRKGTFPERSQVEPHLETFKKLCFTTIDQLKTDFYDGMFKSFERYSTSYGFELNNIEDAIKFNNVHEAMHLGQMKQMMK